MINPRYLHGEALSKFWDKAEAEILRLLDASNGVYPFDAMAVAFVKSMDCDYSNRNYLLSAAIRRNNIAEHDYRTDLVFREGIDHRGWHAEWRKDPWKGHPSVPWKVNGYKIDDALCDLMVSLRGGRVDPEYAIKRLVERLREREYDV